MGSQVVSTEAAEGRLFVSLESHEEQEPSFPSESVEQERQEEPEESEDEEEKRKDEQLVAQLTSGQLSMTDQVSVCAQLGFRTTAKDHGHVGGLLAGKIGANKFVVRSNYFFLPPKGSS